MATVSAPKYWAKVKYPNGLERTFKYTTEEARDRAVREFRQQGLTAKPTGGN